MVEVVKLRLLFVVLVCVLLLRKLLMLLFKVGSVVLSVLVIGLVM